jgi:hypothetical protein
MADAAPYRKAGPYSAGMKALAAGSCKAADARLVAAWMRVRRDLDRAFQAKQCERDVIRATLGRAVFAAPPSAIPAADRFLPPPPVVAAVAFCRCELGDREGAARWLLDAAIAGDADAAAAAAVLLAASGKPDSGLALVPEPGASPVMIAARAFVLARLGRSDEAAKAREAASKDEPKGESGNRVRAILGLPREDPPAP